MKVDLKLGGELFVRMRFCADNAHVEHLRTESFARHQALGQFYEDIVKLADRFAEAAQGAAGARLAFDGTFAWAKSMELALAELKRWIEQNSAALTRESHLLNILDEIKAEIDTTTEHLTRN